MKSYTLKEILQIEYCPLCQERLKEKDKKETLIKSYYDLEMDCITHFECPFCKETFKRDDQELKRVSENYFFKK